MFAILAKDGVYLRRLGKLLLVGQIGLLADPAKAQIPVTTAAGAGTVTLAGIVRDTSGTALAAVEIIVDSRSSPSKYIPRANQIPSRFLGSGGSGVDCGAVFIWTKPVQVRSETTRGKP